MPEQLECHIFGIILTAMNSEEDDTSRIFVKDLGLALTAKQCLDRSQAFQGVNNSQAFPQEDNFPPHFCF